MNSAHGNPQKQPLATWLSAASLLTTFVALAVMALASTIVINRLAQRQALARSELAVSSAREYLRRLGESNLTAARSLANNPALPGLLSAPAGPELKRFLEDYCTALRATACILGNAQGPLAAAGGTMAWPELAIARGNQGERFAIGPRGGGTVLLGAAAAVPVQPDLAVVVVQSLDGELLREAGRQTGAAITVLNLSSYRAPDAEPLTPLHAAALGNRDHAAMRIAAIDRYAASAVLSDATGAADRAARRADSRRRIRPPGRALSTRGYRGGPAGGGARRGRRTAHRALARLARGAARGHGAAHRSG